MTSQRTRERLIQRLEEAGIRDLEVLDVMRQLPRHLFVDEALASRAYEESALPIGHGQTISQPYTVARMTEALLVPGSPDTVLEIGTGSGFQTAVLASLVRRVYSVERVADLSQRARHTLGCGTCVCVTAMAPWVGRNTRPSTPSWSLPRRRGFPACSSIS